MQCPARLPRIGGAKTNTPFLQDDPARWVGGRLAHKKGSWVQHLRFNPAQVSAPNNLSLYVCYLELACMQGQLSILLDVYAFGRVEALVQCLHLRVPTSHCLEIPSHVELRQEQYDLWVYLIYLFVELCDIHQVLSSVIQVKPVKIYSHNLGFRYTKYTHERPCIWDSTPIKYPILIYVLIPS